MIHLRCKCGVVAEMVKAGRVDAPAVHGTRRNCGPVDRSPGSACVGGGSGPFVRRVSLDIAGHEPRSDDFLRDTLVGMACPPRPFESESTPPLERHRCRGSRRKVAQRSRRLSGRQVGSSSRALRRRNNQLWGRRPRGETAKSAPSLREPGQSAATALRQRRISRKRVGGEILGISPPTKKRRAQRRRPTRPRCPT